MILSVICYEDIVEVGNQFVHDGLKSIGKYFLDDFIRDIVKICW